MATIKTPRPVPIITDELTFSRKKKTNLKESHFTPRSPVKSAPPISRIFRRRRGSTPGAHEVSFRQSHIKGEVNVKSPLYTNVDQLYFDQCFTKLSILGAGSFGEVVKVQSKEDGKLYAIKKSRDRFRGDFDRKQRLEEVNKNEQLQGHPNCVHFLNAWEEQEHLYIQSELCEMSLKEYAESVQTVEEKEIWNMIVDLCLGLKHLHDAEFVHMDIKPANLFLGRDGLYKIGDFGLVVELTRDLSDAMDGDAKYLAPELMEGIFSKAADIFSLGITILELACSLELPKGGLLWHQLRTNQLPLEFTLGLSDDLILLVSTMMAPNPTQRPTVDDILAMTSVVQARRKYQTVGKLDIALKPLFYIMFLIRALLSFIYNLISVRKKNVQRCITPPPIPTMFEVNSGVNNGHESLVNHSTSDDNWLIPDPSISPLFNKQSPLFQPVSNKRETTIWKPFSPGLRRTPTNLCSSPHLSDCSPPIAPLSDKIIRSRLFNCSSEDEEILQRVPKNLLDSFNEKWD